MPSSSLRVVQCVQSRLLMFCVLGLFARTHLVKSGTPRCVRQEVPFVGIDLQEPLVSLEESGGKGDEWAGGEGRRSGLFVVNGELMLSRGVIKVLDVDVSSRTPGSLSLFVSSGSLDYT